VRRTLSGGEFSGWQALAADLFESLFNTTEPESCANRRLRRLNTLDRRYRVAHSPQGASCRWIDVHFINSLAAAKVGKPTPNRNRGTCEIRGPAFPSFETRS